MAQFYVSFDCGGWDLLISNIRERVVLVLVKAMKNPRSALCKTSIMASSDIFKAYGDKLLLDGTQSDAFNQMVRSIIIKYIAAPSSVNTSISDHWPDLF